MAEDSRTRASRVKKKGGRYHHGALREALLRAAEEELAEKGVEGFTLRGCARRAGVSHAAPAHHFASVAELLSELAAVAFERLTETIEAWSVRERPGTLAHLTACACGYVAFARENPHHFRLMFRREKLDHIHERAVRAAERAFALPVQAVAAFYGVEDPMQDEVLRGQVIALWSIPHGFADLMLAGQFDHLAGEELEEWIEQRLRTMIRAQFGAPPDAGA